MDISHSGSERLADIFQSPRSGRTYQIVRYLGGGTYGAVYEVRNVESDTRYAAKFYRPNDTSNSFERERDAHLALSSAPDCSPYILCMIEAFEISIPTRNPNEFSLVQILITELMDGDIAHLGVPDQYVEDLIGSMLDGLTIIHQDGFAHRDIKPDNILFSGEDVAYKIGDLGSICGLLNRSLTIANESSTDRGCRFWGTPAFMPPEAVIRAGLPSTLKQSQRSDIWGLGLTLYSTIFQYPIDTTECDNDEEEENFRCITSLTPGDVMTWFPINLIYSRKNPVYHSPNSIVGLLRRMLRVPPNQRWPLKELVSYWHRTSYLNRSQINLADFTLREDCETVESRRRSQELIDLCRHLSSLVVQEGELNYALRLDELNPKQELTQVNQKIDTLARDVDIVLEQGCFDADILRQASNNAWTQIETLLNQDWTSQTPISIRQIEVLECTVQYLNTVLGQLTPP